MDAARAFLRANAQRLADEYANTWQRITELAACQHDTRLEQSRIWNEHAARVRPLQNEHDRVVKLLADLMPVPHVIVHK